MARITQRDFNNFSGGFVLALVVLEAYASAVVVLFIVAVINWAYMTICSESC